MELDIAIGGAVVGGALGLIVYLTIWGRRMIERLTFRNYPSARKADLELDDD